MTPILQLAGFALSGILIVTWGVFGWLWFRSPPPLPIPGGIAARRLVWIPIWLLAGLTSPLGLPLHQETEIRYSNDVEVDDAGDLPGLGQEAVSVIALPVIHVRTETRTGLEGEMISRERQRSLQFPVALAFFLVLAWWGERRTRARPGGHPGTGALCAAALAPCLGASGCGEEGSFASHPAPERQFAAVAYDTVATLGGQAEDTTFLEIRRVRGNADGVFVLDGIARRVLHLDWSGNVRWSAGREGNGPGELSNPRALELDDDGVAWVLDVGNGRLVGFGPGGGVRSEVSLRDLGVTAGTFAPLTGTGGFLAAGGNRDLQMFRLTETGSASRIRTLALEGEGVANDGMALQGSLVSGAGESGWAYALAMGPGFWFSPTLEGRPEFFHYPEAIAPPEVERRMSEADGARSVTTRISSSPVFAARSVSRVGQRLFVHFVGTTDDRGRIVDVYDLGGKAYEFSFLLPDRADVSIWNDRAVLFRDSPAPTLQILKWHREGDRAEG